MNFYDARFNGHDDEDIALGLTDAELLQEQCKIVRQVEELVDEWEASLPVFGPVDGTGRPDPNGMMMVDMPKDGLIEELRRALDPNPPQSRPRRRR